MSERKATKAEANYRPGADPTICANCTMFVEAYRGPHGCTAVEGRISPHGLCDYFEPKAFGSMAP